MKKRKQTSVFNKVSNTVRYAIELSFLKITRTIGSITEFTTKKLTKVLYATTGLEMLSKLPLAGAEIPAGTEHTLWKWLPKKCLPQEKAIYEGYDVFIDTPTLSEAPIIVHIEKHNELLHYQLRAQLLNLFRNNYPAPTVLIEGQTFERTFPCDAYLTCIYPAHDQYRASYTDTILDVSKKIDSKVEKQKCKELDNHNPPAPIHYAFRIPKKFNCRGWDKNITDEHPDRVFNLISDDFPNLVEKTTDLEEQLNNIVSKRNQHNLNTASFRKQVIENSRNTTKILKEHIKTFPNFQKETEQLENGITKMSKHKDTKYINNQIELIKTVQKKINQHITDIVNRVEATISSVENNIVSRNQEQIKSIDKIRAGKVQAIVSTGELHVISTKDRKILDKTGKLKKAALNSEQRELRDYYGRKSAALLFPKKQISHKPIKQFKR